LEQLSITTMTMYAGSRIWVLFAVSNPNIKTQNSWAVTTAIFLCCVQYKTQPSHTHGSWVTQNESSFFLTCRNAVVMIIELYLASKVGGTHNVYQRGKTLLCWYPVLKSLTVLCMAANQIWYKQLWQLRASTCISEHT
jgi:hypothetical protein